MAEAGFRTKNLLKVTNIDMPINGSWESITEKSLKSKLTWVFPASGAPRHEQKHCSFTMCVQGRLSQP